jgi:putative membrane protein
MLWIKTLHIVFVVSWFAGLFYLPRIFVNLAMAKSDEEHARLKLMAAKLYRFMTPLGILAIVFGLWLWFGYGFSGGWLHLKTLLVAGLVGYHLYCRHILWQFAAGSNVRTHVWFRWFNEIPVIVLFVIVGLVVFKPF